MSTRFAKPEAERALVGALLLDADKVAEARGTVLLDDFRTPALRDAARALWELDEGRAVIDLATVAEWLEADPDASRRPPKGGWKAFVVGVATEATSASFVPHHCRQLRDTSVLRDLAETLDRGAREAASVQVGVGSQVSDFLDEIEVRVHRAGDRRLDGAEIVDMGALAPGVCQEIVEGQSDPGLPTGIPDVDDLLLGLRSGELIVVAARPGQGKTTFGLQIALHAASKGARVLFLSLEMGKQQLVERLLGNLASVDSATIRSQRLSAEETFRLQAAARQLGSLKIDLIEDSATTVNRLRGLARRHMRRHGIGLIVVDYLQLMSDPQRKDRYQEVSSISRGLKALANELHVPVIAVSQLSRAGDADRPRLSHLRDSGSIEQDADVVVMLWTEQEGGPLLCAVEKNRNGRTGTTRLAFLREYYKIAGLTRQEAL